MELDLRRKGKNIKNFPSSEGILCKDMAEITRRIAEVKDNVKKINLDRQRSLKEIPLVLGECKQLEELDLSHTGIREIPDFIFTLPNLRVLTFRCSELNHFPRGITRAGKLEKLIFRVNKTWAFPEEITSLQNLKVLAADIYSPTALPSNLGALKYLEVLSMSVKYDEEYPVQIPESLDRHPSIKKININDPLIKIRKKFNLEHACKILETCPVLESLKLSGFSVGDGHGGLSALVSLKELELRHLLARGNIFKSIANLRNLEILDIQGSDFNINEIPDVFGNMKELRIFSFAGNMIQKFPPSFYGLSKLEILEISGTGITELDEKTANLKNLESLDVHDNILNGLPNGIFNLSRLRTLNIEENIFSESALAELKEIINKLAEKGQRIEFLYGRQRHRKMVKKLLTLNNIEKMDAQVYAKYCLAAITENPLSLKIINKDKLKGTKYYALLCMAAARKNPAALENVDIGVLGKAFYFHVCMEAAGNRNIGSFFKLIKDDFLTNDEYLQVCLKAALHNREPDFIGNFNSDKFHSRFNREIYDHICWAAVLHNPQTISKMSHPTKEVKEIAERRKKAKVQ